MYKGNENLINDGEYMPFTMLNFWQWAYSNLIHNMLRGTFADFVVKCALDTGGIITRSEIGTGLEPYDLEGPIIPSTGKTSRIEVKSAAFVQTWDIKHPDRANFSIAPATLPDETGDFVKGTPRQRNNDVYVFTLYTAKDKRCNILDLSWWEFYVLPTYKIEGDKDLRTQKTISLKRVREICQVQSFNTLCSAIADACNSIPAEYNICIFPPKGEKVISDNVNFSPPRKIRRDFSNFLLIKISRHFFCVGIFSVGIWVVGY